ncbi:hypothetical protein PsYK624_099670 [Phanerochaete sordida]|uniref:Uncharacterized protein n=1 Tax=Phanerochaete sordida TaxID=48140 RepID=A0A9P3LG04_9APHY|nr:hypothetical protein PsYK624_099670 [Phanerochaete sordida]
MKVTLSTVFVMDGTLYFVVLIGLHATQLVVSRSMCLAPLLYIMSSVLVSRFLLNLRQVNEQSNMGSTVEQQSTLQFAGAVGGLSAPLALSDCPSNGANDADYDGVAL